MDKVTSIEVLDTQTTIVDAITNTDTESIDVYKSDIRESVNTDEDLNKNDIIKELDIEMTQNTKVSDETVQPSNAILKEIDSDGTETKNATVEEKKDNDIEKTKSSIVLDEIETDNFIVLDANRTDSDVIVVDSKETVSDVIVLDTNRTASDDIVLVENITDSDIIVIDKKSDSDVIVLDGNRTDSEITIILDEDEINKVTERLPKPYIPVIDVEKDTDCSIIETNSTVKPKKQKNEFNEVFKENPLLTELIEKCLDMENSEGMSRVINRTLLAIYKNIEESYKKSDAFRKVVTKAIMQLDVEPERKFSHLQNLCNELKQHSIKKRVPFITLEEKEEQSATKRRRVDAFIDLADDTGPDIQQNPQGVVKAKKDYPIGKVYPPIEINDDSSDVMSHDDDVILLDKNYNSNKENTKTCRKKVTKTRKKNWTGKKRRRPRKINLSHKKHNVTNKIMNQIIPNIDVESLETNNVFDPGNLLEPRLSVEVFAENQHERINYIETQIAHMKKQVEELEEAEVIKDNDQSPYIKCEQIKTSICNYYKELCQLTGTEATKRHEVRLHVVQGHPEGPVRCLEEFLNANIDEEGNPPFPDMQDVTRCVWEANERFNMNWSRLQVLHEAHALFTQFGRSMQKRRQQREWKDLMSLVKLELPDPADEDPVLQALLAENTRIAKRNEQELLQRFANMEPISRRNPELRLSINQSEESDEDTSNHSEENLTHIAPPCKTVTEMGPLIAASEITVRADLEPQKAGNELTMKVGLGPQKAASEITVRSDLYPPKAASELTMRAGLGPQKAVNESNVKPDFGPQKAASELHVGADLDPKKCSENTLQLFMRSDASDSDKALGYGSKVTVCDGKLVIQPTIDYCVFPNQNIPKIKSRDEMTLYSSEFQTFILNLKDEPLPMTKSTQNAKNARKKIVNKSSVQRTLCDNNENDLANAKNAPKNLANNDSVQGKVTANNKNDLENAARLADVANLAKEILSLVQSDCTTTGLDKETLNLQCKTVQLNDHNSFAKENNCYVKLTNADFKANNSNTTFKLNEKPDGFHTFTHTSKSQGSLSIKEPNETAGKELTPCKDSKIPEVNKDPISDTITNENIEDVVKPEPLDIPSMLAELGEGFTATIFDIEDPFLVIEISDSSESEDDDL